MQSQTNPWDEGVPRRMSVEAFTPDLPGAHAAAGMPVSAWTQAVGADGAVAGAGAGGEPAGTRASSIDPAPALALDADGAGRSVGAPVRTSDGLLSRASNEQLLQAAVRATREAAQAAAELRRSLEQHKRRTTS